MVHASTSILGNKLWFLDKYVTDDRHPLLLLLQVRSNTLGAVGFLGDSRRMNVAITRARKHVAVVCDSSTICHNTFLARLLRHIRRFGRVRHAEPGSFEGPGLSIDPLLPSINWLMHHLLYTPFSLFFCLFSGEGKGKDCRGRNYWEYVYKLFWSLLINCCK